MLKTIAAVILNSCASIYTRYRLGHLNFGYSRWFRISIFVFRIHFYFKADAVFCSYDVSKNGRLPGSGSPSSSHFEADKGPGKKEKDHMTQLGCGNQYQKNLAQRNMQDQHYFIGAPLVMCHKAG